MDSQKPQQSHGHNISEFSLKLLQKLSGQTNLVFSPASIYIALAMTAIGSKEATLEQFKSLLNFNSSEQLAQDTQQIQSFLVKQGNGITTQIANKIFLELPQLGQEYEGLMNKNFQTAMEKVSFSSNYDQVRLNINEWVSQQTNQKIKDLLTQGTLNNLTRMVLVNAIYFKGDWLSKFDSEKTNKQDFHLEYQNAGKSVQADMMHREDKYDFFQNEEFKYVSIPYKGEEYVMEIVLPNQSLEKFESSLKHETFLQAREQKRNIKIKLSLPKFKIQPSQSTALKDILSQLGIPKAFSDDANFSFMDPSNSIKVSDVYHKAMIEVNEEGAEAAAATAVVMMLRCAPMAPPSVECTKPFIYSITHKTTNTIMFLGKVTNPLEN